MLLKDLQKMIDNIQSHETQFVIDAINRLGGFYTWSEDEDGQKPLIPVTPFGEPEDLLISSVRVTDGTLELTGKDKDGNKYEFDSSKVYIGYLHYITDYLPRDEEEPKNIININQN